MSEEDVKEKTGPGTEFSDLGRELLSALEKSDFDKMVSLTDPYFPTEPLPGNLEDSLQSDNKSSDSELKEKEAKAKKLKQKILYRLLSLPSEVLSKSELAVIIKKLDNSFALKPSIFPRSLTPMESGHALSRLLSLPSGIFPDSEMLSAIKKLVEVGANIEARQATDILCKVLNEPRDDGALDDSDISYAVKKLVAAGADLDAPALSSVHHPLSDLYKMPSKLLEAAKKRDFAEMDRLMTYKPTELLDSKSSNPKDLKENAIQRSDLHETKPLLPDLSNTESKSSKNPKVTDVLYRLLSLPSYTLTDSEMLPIVKELVKAGADLKSPIPSRMRPYDHYGSVVNLAIHSKKLGVAKYLVEKHANLNIRTKINHTPFDLLYVHRVDLSANEDYRALDAWLKPQPKNEPDLREEYGRWYILFALTSVLTFSASAGLVAVSAASIKGKEISENLLSSYFEFPAAKAHQISNFFDEKSLGVPGVSIGVPLAIISMAVFFYAMSKLIETFAHNEAIDLSPKYSR